ncbi:adhesin [Desulfopila sp. IMCC35008]|uniref:adhesin n=1 Tax=Desulfopila sp. IMCC35008 TaxID=2653858 RepID=UPI0013D7731B|nr:adhesin [Desulfopila sp. IMCC35008]
MIRGLYVLIFTYLMTLTGCGSLTGIPGHGGGKRFAVEQELVAATTRATIKQIDISAIKGKKVNLFVNAIGDTGNGNLIGGRLSFVSQLRGDYIHSPPVVESYSYPQYTQTTTSSSSTKDSSSTLTETIQDAIIPSNQSTVSSLSSTSGKSMTTTLLPSPDQKQIQQKGSGSEVQVGVEYKGLGAYQNSEEISSDDLQYLSGLLQTYFFLSGVNIVPPSEAEVDVYVTVDVFGTIRTRVDWFVANNEILRAKTALEVMAINSLSGDLVMAPQSAGSEAEYNEQYIFWAGPVSIRKRLRPTNSLLCDFTDLSNAGGLPDLNVQDGDIPYPFRYEIGKWMEVE